MLSQELHVMKLMTDEQRILFSVEFEKKRKRSGTAVVLALLFGGLGAHHFYMGNHLTGAIYACLSITLVPSIVAFVEAFLMPERVEKYNGQKALEIAALIKAVQPRPKAPKTPPVFTYSDIPITIEDPAEQK